MTTTFLLARLRRSAVRAAVVLLAVSLVAVGPAHAEGRAHVYRVQHRSAEELLPLAETVMAGQGSAVIDAATNSIVLIGPSGAVAETMTLLAKQDRRLRTIVIHHEERTTRELTSEGVTVDFSVGTGALRIGNLRFPDDATGVDVEAHAGQRESRRELASTMRVIEGQRTRITTGTSVPFAVGRRGERHTEWLSAESGVDATARVLGDGRVEVDLAAFSARFRRGGSIAHGDSQSLVTLEPGTTVAVGGIAEEGERGERDVLSGAAHEREREERVLLLRVELE